MSAWSSTTLAKSVLGTLQDVLIHQRARWASLFEHRHQYEGWWKAEFYLALESWCWRMDLPGPTWVRSEVKPRQYGIGGSAQSIDLLVARWSDATLDMVSEPPRFMPTRSVGYQCYSPEAVYCGPSGHPKGRAGPTPMLDDL